MYKRAEATVFFALMGFMSGAMLGGAVIAVPFAAVFGALSWWRHWEDVTRG